MKCSHYAFRFVSVALFTCGQANGHIILLVVKSKCDYANKSSCLPPCILPRSIPGLCMGVRNVIAQIETEMALKTGQSNISSICVIWESPHVSPTVDKLHWQYYRCDRALTYDPEASKGVGSEPRSMHYNESNSPGLFHLTSVVFPSIPARNCGKKRMLGLT